MLDRKMGRYEFIDPTKNAKRFWVVSYDQDKNSFFTAWGRIGSVGRIKEGLSEFEAQQKINEKIKEGYKLVKQFKMTMSSYEMLLFEDKIKIPQQENAVTKKKFMI